MNLHSYSYWLLIECQEHTIFVIDFPREMQLISIQSRREPTTGQRNDCTNVQLDKPVASFIGVTNKNLGERLLMLNRGSAKAAAPTEVPTPETWDPESLCKTCRLLNYSNVSSLSLSWSSPHPKRPVTLSYTGGDGPSGIFQMSVLPECNLCWPHGSVLLWGTFIQHP